MTEENKNVKKGGISVDTEHIFPIIKKWLYSEKDIFLREIVSNASDAVTKLKRLESLGIREATDDNYRITVALDKDAGTLTVSDNGIGMTEEELDKYICSIALSGAVDFIQKYESESTEGAKNGIIGHFGLGFYSAFMVSDSVEIETKSYTDAPSVHWVCSESGEYELSAGERTERGTSVIMHISESESEYLSKSKIRAILEKYCSFMPVEIYFEDADDEPKADAKPINDTFPLWQKNASDCTDEDYRDFYSRVFSDYKAPLFHIHINADYPLNFKGILYFPKLSNEYETVEGQVKLYYNQVFVADNIKEVIPEYLLMLRGVLDCPELPLNVSRSYLQNSAYVSKVSQYIVRKVADKLVSMFKNEREHYESLWKDLKTFVEYGAISERKFYDRVKDALLLALADGGVMTVADCIEQAGERKTVYYASDLKAQAQLISMYASRGYKVVATESILDDRFLQFLESVNEGVKFVRVDADTSALREDGEEIASEKLSAIFEAFSTEKCKLTVRVERLADTSVPAVLTLSEEGRRMKEMMRMYAIDMPDLPEDMTLVLNAACPLIERLESDGFKEQTQTVAKHIYMLALIAQRGLTADEMKSFLSESYGILGLIS